MSAGRPGTLTRLDSEDEYNRAPASFDGDRPGKQKSLIPDANPSN